MTSARPVPDALFDQDGVMQRYWLDSPQWIRAQAQQRKAMLLLLAMTSFGCLLTGLAFVFPASLRIPAALFVSVDVVCVLHLARGLYQVRRPARPLSVREARVLSARIRRVAPGLLRSLDAWMQTGIPLVAMDANILYDLLKSLRLSAHFEDADTWGFEPGQRVGPQQQTPFGEADRAIVLPWERGQAIPAVG